QNPFTLLATDFSAFSHLGTILLQPDAAGKDMPCGHQNIMKTNVLVFYPSFSQIVTKISNNFFVLIC
ncbi:MAG: hypothetical protein WDZ47_05710, partial [Bacteroidales bacterium]